MQNLLKISNHQITNIWGQTGTPHESENFNDLFIYAVENCKNPGMMTFKVVKSAFIKAKIKPHLVEETDVSVTLFIV